MRDEITFKDILIFMIESTALLFFIILITWLLFAGYAKYSIWSQAQHGQAELRRAEFTKKIAVQDAIAKMESSKMLAQAEVERAKGVAEANKIIGESLKNNESYLRYLWIDSLHTTNNQVVYVPTEGNLPILEAGKR